MQGVGPLEGFVLRSPLGAAGRRALSTAARSPDMTFERPVWGELV